MAQTENGSITEATNAAKRISDGYTPLEKAGAIVGLTLTGFGVAKGIDTVYHQVEAKNDLAAVAEINRDGGNVGVAEAIDATLQHPVITTADIDPIRDVMTSSPTKFPNTIQPEYYAGLSVANLANAQEHVDQSATAGRIAAGAASWAAIAGLATSTSPRSRKK